MANELNAILDTGQENYQSLKCKQNDIRTLVATLLDKGSPFSFTGYTGIDIRVKKADNTVYIQTLIPNSFTLTNNVLTVKLEQDITRVAGTAELEIMIKFGSDTITSFTFNLDVVASVIVDGAVASENTINLLEMIKAAWTPISNSPKGTYATLTALNAAYPNGDSNVYVIAADGTWRYWNGTTWASGGLYQSAGIADDSIAYEKLDKTSVGMAGLTGVATRLVQGTDFNTVYKAGPYDCWNAVNVPFQGWIKVFCIPSNDNNTTSPNLVTQIATGMDDHIGQIYVRQRNATNTWSDWIQLYSPVNEPKAADVLQDSNNRFVKDTDIANWNNASDLVDILAVKDENGNIITDNNGKMIIS